MTQRFDTTIGSDYDIFNKVYPFTEKLQKDSVKYLMDSIGIYQKKILEIGTGNGETTLELIKKFNNTQIDTVDISFIMLESAKIILNQVETTNTINFFLQDILDYTRNIPDQTYDGIISVFTIHNITQSQREILYKELGRILKHGGTFVNGDKVANNNEEDHKENLDLLLRSFKKFNDDYNRPDLEKERVTHCLRDEEHDLKMTIAMQEKILQDAGFGSIVYGERMLTEIITSAKKL